MVAARKLVNGTVQMRHAMASRRRPHATMPVCIRTVRCIHSNTWLLIPRTNAGRGARRISASKSVQSIQRVHLDGYSHHSRRGAALHCQMITRLRHRKMHSHIIQRRHIALYVCYAALVAQSVWQCLEPVLVLKTHTQRFPHWGPRSLPAFIRCNSSVTVYGLRC